jgi:hypothetical protein
MEQRAAAWKAEHVDPHTNSLNGLGEQAAF